MSSSKCARCDKTVYPVEGLRCLDKIWHKGCFKCHECNMTLNMKNYKGFEKRPYCNAHCPQAKATTVADTPESRRLAENTRIQSQAKYHEDFEKSKGKNFTTIADDPETRRIKEASKIISNASYHGDLDRKKQMEERRGLSEQDELPMSRISSNNNVVLNNNNNNINMKHRIQSNNANNNSQSFDHHDLSPAHQSQQQQRLIQQQQFIQKQQQQQHQQQAQQLLLKQQQQYVQPMVNRKSSGLIDNQQLPATRNVQQHTYPVNPTQQYQQQPQPQQQLQLQLQLHQQQQHQQMNRQQQQQQIIIQQQRQSFDASIPMNRQVSKQAIISTSNHPLMKHPNLVPVQQQQQQQQIKYMPINDPMNGQQMSHHIAGMPPHMMHQMTGVMPPQGNNRRPNSQQSGPPPQAAQHHPMMHGYNPHPIGSMNGVMPKHSAPMSNMQPSSHIIQHPDQMQQQQLNHRSQMRPATNIGHSMQSMQQQVPKRVFRAMYDYVANDVDEVSFLENDILVDCVNVDRNWLIGKVARSGQTGMLPANYVELLPSQ